MTKGENTGSMIYRGRVMILTIYLDDMILLFFYDSRLF